MFGFCDTDKVVAVAALVGLGLYAQSNEINLANNTSMLLLLLFLFMEENNCEKYQKENYAYHALNGCCNSAIGFSGESCCGTGPRAHRHDRYAFCR